MTKKEDKKIRLWWFSKAGKTTLKVILWITIWFFFIIWIFATRIMYLQWNKIDYQYPDFPNLPEIVTNLSLKWQENFGIKIPCEINITESTQEEIANYQKIHNKWSIKKQLWLGWLYRCDKERVESVDTLARELWITSYNSIFINKEFTWAEMEVKRDNIIRIPSNSFLYNSTCDNIIQTDQWTKCESYTTHDLKLLFHNTKEVPFFTVWAYDKNFNEIWQPNQVEFIDGLLIHNREWESDVDGDVCIILTAQSPITNYYRSLYDSNCEVIPLRRKSSQHEELVLADFAYNWKIDRDLVSTVTIAPIEVTIPNPELQ